MIAGAMVVGGAVRGKSKQPDSRSSVEDLLPTTDRFAPCAQSSRQLQPTGVCETGGRLTPGRRAVQRPRQRQVRPSAAALMNGVGRIVVAGFRWQRKARHRGTTGL
jgi:hypothetical protein